MAFLYREPLSLLAVSLLWAGMIFLYGSQSRRRIGKFNMTVIFSLILGIYSLYVITIFSEKKTNENLKVQALSFSTENDPEAEHLLLDMWPEISERLRLLVNMMDDEISTGLISAQSQPTCMKLILMVTGAILTSIFTFAEDGQSLRVGPDDNNFENCFGFFDERIRKYGHQLTGTEFYFIDNQGGRSYYLGRLFFKTSQELYKWLIYRALWRY